MTLRIDPATAASAVRAYNAGSYRGRRNIDVDRAAYDRFRSGLPTDERMLIDCIRFVGEDYGGAQARFLPHGYREEAALIVARFKPCLEDWTLFVNSARPLADEPPDEVRMTVLLRPFEGTKRWPVWATKTMHFIRPDAFPILDSRARKAIGLANLGGTPRDYVRYCSTVRDILGGNHEALDAARRADESASPSDLKLLDKILYQLGT